MADGLLKFFTWYEVAVSWEGVVGADVTINKTHYSDMGTDFFTWMDFPRQSPKKQSWENKETYQVHGARFEEKREELPHDFTVCK